MKKKAFPYDKFFKSVLTLRRAAEELLVYCLPQSVVSNLQLDTLQPVKDSFLDERLREHFADVVYSCPTLTGEDVQVCFLFEHKSERPADPVALQLMRYMLNLWEHHWRQKRHLGPVIPIVIYHGRGAWEKETLGKLIRGAGLFPTYLPDFDFVFINLQSTPDTELIKPGSSLLQAFFLLLKYAREEEFIRRNFARIVIFAETRTEDFEFTFFYKVMLKYIISISTITKTELHAMIDDTKDDDYLRFGENDHEVSLLHLLYDEDEIEEMKKRGLEEGRREGLQQGLQEGLQEGLQQGLQEGLQQGLEQGKIEAILAILRKHPEWSDQTIAELLDVTETLVQKVRSEHLGT